MIENADYSGATRYFTDRDGNVVSGSVANGDVAKMLQDKSLKPVDVTRYADRDGKEYSVPTQNTVSFLTQANLENREVARIERFENEGGDWRDVPMFEDRFEQFPELRQTRIVDRDGKKVEEPAWKPSTEWMNGGLSSLRPVDRLNIATKILDPEHWGVSHDDEGNVNVGESAAEIAERAGRGTLAAASGIVTGAAGFIGDAIVDLGSLNARMFGWAGEKAGLMEDGATDDAIRGVRAGWEGVKSSVREGIVDNILGDMLTNSDVGRDLANMGMSAAETYGGMRIGLGGVGKAGQAIGGAKGATVAVGGTFGVGGFEHTKEDIAVQQAGLKGDAVAIVKGAVDAVAGHYLGKVLAGVKAPFAGKAMEQTLAKAVGLAVGETLEGGLAMAGMQGAEELGKGIAGIGDVKQDENGNVVIEDVPASVRFQRVTNAFEHGLMVTAGLKMAELAPRTLYGAFGTSASKAVTYNVEMARKTYAPHVEKLCETARMMADAHEPIVQGKGIGKEVRAVTTNGEVVLHDGSIYYPPTADRTVTTEAGTATIKGREARIVVSDGTILNAKGDVVGKLAGGQMLGRSVDTVAETYVRANDANSGNEFTIIDPNTGTAGIANVLDVAPEGFKAYRDWLIKGQTFKAPDLDADTVHYMRLMNRYRMGGDIGRAAELALGDVHSGRKTMKEAAEALDAAERQFGGERVEKTSTKDSSDSQELKDTKVVNPTQGRIEVNPGTPEVNAMDKGPGEDKATKEIPKKATQAAAEIVVASETGEMIPSDVDLANVVLPEAVKPGAKAPEGTMESPVIMWENPETGKLEIIDGNKRVAAEAANGAKSVKAVVLRASDGWTRENAEAVGLTANLRDGTLDAAGMVDAYKLLGVDLETALFRGILVEPGADAPLEQRQKAQQQRAALNIAMWGSVDLRANVNDGNLMKLSAIVDKVNVRTWGDGWREMQRELAANLEGVDAATSNRALEMARNLSKRLRTGRVTVERIVEAAKYAESNGFESPRNELELRILEEKMAADKVAMTPVEQPDGTVKTLTESESGMRSEGERYVIEDPAGVKVPGTGTVDDLKQSRENNGIFLEPIAGSDGMFGCARFPALRVRETADSVELSGITPEEMADPRNREELSRIVGEILRRADGDGVTKSILFPEGSEAQANLLIDIAEIGGYRQEDVAKGDAVMEMLEKSGLQTEVITDEATFNQVMAKSKNGRALTAGDSVYGFTDGKRIFLNPKFFGTREAINTKIHEFGHLGIIACESVNKAVYDRGMQLAGELKEELDALRNTEGCKGLSEDQIKQEILARLIGKRGEEMIRNIKSTEVRNSVIQWIKEFWRSFGAALGLREITAEQASKMTIEQVADAIRSEMMKGGKFGDVSSYDKLALSNQPKATREQLKQALVEKSSISKDVDSDGGYTAGDGTLMMNAGGPQRFDRSRLVFGRARVADEAGRGEQLPGPLAASRELATQSITPMSANGRLRQMSLPLSEMEWLRRALTGDSAPAQVARRIAGGNTYSAHNKSGKLVIAADIFGTVDKTDMAQEKTTLVQHGFFRNENPTWCASKTPADIRAERERSEQQLATNLLGLADRRAHGAPGGQEAARGVFADELAKIIMDMPGVPAGGVLGQVRTIGQSVRDEILNRFSTVGVRGAAAESQMKQAAGDFLDWAYGQQIDPATGMATNRRDTMSLKDMTSSMFGAFLVMPAELGRRAPRWHDAIVDIIGSTPKLENAFRDLTIRSMSEQSAAAVMEQIRQSQNRQAQEAIAKLVAEGTEPIKPANISSRLIEPVVVGLHDKLGPVAIRIDDRIKTYLAAQKAALKAATSPAQKAYIQQQIDLFMGNIAHAKNQMNLSRIAMERGGWNEGRRYFVKMLLLENEASERWGLSEDDRSLFLDMRRVIETQGRASSFGQSVRQAQLTLDAMQRRLGSAKWTKLEEYARKFFAIHEMEILNDARLELAFGKEFVDYCRTQESYVSTKRTWSPEELQSIEAIRRQMRQLGVRGSDDVISQMFTYAGSRGAGESTGESGWTARLVGSMAAKQEVRSATWEKMDRLMQFVRRNKFVIDMRDALIAAGVEGVSDHKRTDVPVPENARYGRINYLENGQKRTLVVPRQIADGFKRDADSMKFVTKVNGFCRSLYIDYNVAYWNRNINRNLGSIEKNMPGMHESWAKTVLRAVAPGLSTVSDVALNHIVRHLDEKSIGSKALRSMFGKNTPIFWVPKAGRMAKLLSDPTTWQEDLWAAQDAGDIEKFAEMQEDLRDTLEMLKANMLVGSTKRAYNGDTDGFANDIMNAKGFKMLTQVQNQAQHSKTAKIIDAIKAPFKRNQEQQNYEDVLAKTIAYLHDRYRYGLERTVQETGATVAGNVSIGQGERSGTAKRPLQGFISPFFNMIEKGVVRHWKAIGDRPRETLSRDARVWMGRFVGQAMGSGLLSALILWMNDGDDEKARNGKLGLVYRYGEFWRNAAKNLSSYVRKNYMTIPIWTSESGYTTVVIGLPLNDEDKLVTPTADLAAQMLSHKYLGGAKPDVAGAVAGSTYGAVVPDFQAATPAVTLMQDTVESLAHNPIDLFRGTPKYDPDLYAVRGESPEMAGKFAAAVGMQLWNDLGGRAFIETPRNGADDGQGEAPKWLHQVLTKIPVVSPVLKSFIKIQVGSPENDGKPVTEEIKRRQSLVKVLSKELLGHALRDDAPLYDVDPSKFEEKMEGWRVRYELGQDEIEKIEANLINAWSAKQSYDYSRDEKRDRLRDKAFDLGIDNADFWLLRGEH